VLDDAAWDAFRARVATMPLALRTKVARRWSDAALAEHASIASFARFTLQLLAVGAPPTLLAQAHQAGLDEIEHARLSFRVASAFAGEALGPGPLPSPPSSGVDTLEDVTRATLLEGCVAETLAAHEAEHAAREAVDPVLRAVLARVAADEARHAELAWAFVGWAVETGGENVMRVVRGVAGEARATFPGEVPAADDEDLRAFGALPPAMRARLARACLEHAVLPALEALAR
jgi:hypothetical protein